MAVICKQVHYTGMVQGVGFRATARHVARRFAVAGFVRNLPGGQVELVAEGEDADVERFLDAVTAEMAGYIHAQEVRDMVPAGHVGFEVRR